MPLCPVSDASSHKSRRTAASSSRRRREGAARRRRFRSSHRRNGKRSSSPSSAGMSLCVCPAARLRSEHIERFEQKNMPHVTNLNHAVLYVSDVARSLDFYLAAFGFEGRPHG